MSGRPRRGHRKDANTDAIVATFKHAGFDVHPTNGTWDLTVRLRATGEVRLIEVKDGDKPPSKRKLTDAEAKFHAQWGKSVVIIENADDVIKLRKEMLGG